MPDILQNLISYFSNETNRQFIFFISKYISIVLSVLLIMGIIILFLKVLKFRPKINISEALKLPQLSAVSSSESAIVKEKWLKILERYQSGSPENFILAIIEADNLIDSVLKTKGLAGKDMGERLKSINKNQLNSLERLWEAHKLRNKIAHDSNFHLTNDEAKNALGSYRAALKELVSI